jgi:hypothetical protein
LVSEICSNGIDDNKDGVIDEEECTPPITEICDNQIDDDGDGKIDIEDEDCAIVKPTVVIESATDEKGKSLSPGDLIAPGEVTFTFSSKPSEKETPLDSQENSQDYKFECSLDDESFNSCTSPEKVVIEDGKHTFVVRLTS